MNSKALIAIILLVSITIFIAIFISVGSSGKKSPTPVNKPVIAVAPKPLVAINDIVGTPIVYNGLNVESESQITGWVTKKSFMVTAGATGFFGGGGKSLLVIARDDFTLPQVTSVDKLGLGEKASIHMKGRVVIVNITQLQDYLGEDFKSDEFKLDPYRLSSWTFGPVLLLDSVAKLQK
jgi:hypothetical protein